MVNKVILIGHLGKDPVLKHFSNDNAIAEFSLATNENYRDKEGKVVEQTEWHNIKIPTKRLAEVAEKYLHKGSKVYIEGKIRTRSWDDKDGVKRYTTEIIAESFKMLDGRPDGNKSQESSNFNQGGGSSYTGSSSQPPVQQDAPPVSMDDDLPF